jgi:diguanylate cyclase (GGDEF)-like protein/PAS domain S-box-containing protein
MAEPASVRVWTDDEMLAAFDMVDVVFARDGAAAGTALPRALTRKTAGRLLQTWADQVSLLHPDDRVATVQLWWDSMQQPGTLHHITVRSRVGQRWRQIELRSLNLLHQPGVRAVLMGTTDLGPADGPSVIERPSSRAAHAWTYKEVDAVGILQRVDGDTVSVFGRDADDLIGTSLPELLHPDDRDAAIAMWIDLITTPGSAGGMRLRTVHPDGAVRWIETTVTNRLESPQGAMVIISVDISERIEQEAVIQASQEEFRTLAEEVPIAVFRADAGGRITFGNGRWFNLTSSVGVVEFLIDLVAVEQRKDWRERWAAFISDDDADTVTMPHPTPDHRRLFSVHCRRVHAHGGEPSFIGVLSDVTDEAELRHRADHDSLTGLLNREAFDRALHTTLESGQLAVVAFVDLDGFKEINDALGHEAGDYVLREVARRLTECVRPGDAVGRYGGDEFVVLCTGLPDGGEDGLRKRITHALAPAVEWDESRSPLHASIGGVRSEPGDDVTDVIRRADHAMYEDKHARQSRRRQGWWNAG